MSALAVEVWTTNGGLRMDSFVVGHDAAAALAYAQKTWKREWCHGRNALLQCSLYICVLSFFNHGNARASHPPPSLIHHDLPPHAIEIISFPTPHPNPTAKFDAELKAEEAAKQANKAEDRAKRVAEAKEKDGWKGIAKVYLCILRGRGR